MTDQEIAVFEDRFRQSVAERLVTCAVMLQSEEMKNLSVANPYPYKTPSVPGEYPKARTFNLRNSIEYHPTGLDEIKRTLRIRVGYAARAFYGPILATKGRKWMIDTLNALRPAFAKILAGIGIAREV